MKVFDGGVGEFPVVNWVEHKREVFGVGWNLVAKDTCLSCSWDGTIKIVCSPFTSPLLCTSTLSKSKSQSRYGLVVGVSFAERGRLI